MVKRIALIVVTTWSVQRNKICNLANMSKLKKVRIEVHFEIEMLTQIELAVLATGSKNRKKYCEDAIIQKALLDNKKHK